MAVRPLSTIKSWFETNDIPTQTQFWDTWDSFWHKEEGIPTTGVTDLDTIIGDLYAQIASVSGSLSLPSAKILVGNASNVATPMILSGDATIDNVGALSLATVNSNVFASNIFLKFGVNAKGLVTSAEPVALSDITGALGYTPYNATNPAAFIDLVDLSATTPLSYNNGTGVFSIQQASGSQAGFLSSTDWTTFNNKQNAIPSQTGNNGKFLATDGSTLSWGTGLNIYNADGTIPASTTRAVTFPTGALLTFTKATNNATIRLDGFDQQFIAANSGSGVSQIAFARAFGNLTTPTVVSAGAGIADWAFDAYTNTGYTRSMGMVVYVDSVSGDTPYGKISFTDHAFTDILTIHGQDKSLQFHGYGSGRSFASATGIAGFDNSGNVVRVDPSTLGVGAGSQIGGTTDSNGDITVTHGLGYTPIGPVVSIVGATPYLYTVQSSAATTFRVRFFIVATGVAAASTSIDFLWLAK